MNYLAESTWENYDSAHQADLRIAKLLAFLPSDVETILDAGCGNGIITNKLIAKYQVTGLDISPAALKYLQCPVVQASVTEIPFPAKSFDAVICNEVLEHLDNAALQKAVQELKRVANKYIIISVPYKEQLEKLYYRCANCGFTEHVYGHLQSFSEDTLVSYLAPEFYLKNRDVFGPLNRDFKPLLLKIRQRWLKQWSNPGSGAKCSRCQQEKFEIKKTILSKGINSLNVLLERKRPYWFMGLFIKKAAEQ
ncbi:MAG TPA: class I SAM-dependent methyltransferase [Candidatus Cloacimonas sp.]|nr:class I SAM-dependent methyltransferase [Candidatus Cloacimonas sp.]